MNRTVALIARREIVGRWQQRGYRISLAVTLLIAVIAVIIPSFFSGGDSSAKSYDIGVASDAGRLATVLPVAARAQQVEVRVHRASVDDARSKVENGGWDAAVLPGPTILAQHRSDGVVGFVQAAYADASIVARLQQAGLSTTQAADALRVQPLQVAATKSDETRQRETIAIVTVVVLFSQLIAFCTWVATGVVEEKASRVVGQRRAHALLRGRIHRRGQQRLRLRPDHLDHPAGVVHRHGGANRARRRPGRGRPHRGAATGARGGWGPGSGRSDLPGVGAAHRLAPEAAAGLAR